MASLAVVFDLIAKDNASREIRNVGDAADDAGKRGSRFGEVMKAGLLAGAAAAVAFGKSSIDAYKESEQSSIRLDEALRKFPMTNDRNRASFDKLNESLAKKTRFDDDATASGQAVLAQFKLTGAQIQDLTPLLQDYAAKTGRDLPAAATVLGKAVLGNAKALKEVGINLPPATDAVKNLGKAQDAVTSATDKAYSAQQKLELLRASLSEKDKLSAADKIRLAQAEEAVETAVYKHRDSLKGLETAQAAAKTGGDQFSKVTEELRKQVGGFAEKEGKTAAGQTEILKNRFGEVQEKVGAKLVPVLTTFIGKLIEAIAFTEKHHKVIVPLIGVVGGLTAAVVAVNAATAASSAVTAAAATVRGIFTATIVAETGATRASTLSRIADTVATTAGTVAKGIGTAATVAMTGAQTALNFALRANPIGLVITAVGLLAAAVVIAYQKSETFRGAVDQLWVFLKRFIGFTPLGFLIKNFDDVWKAIRTAASWASEFFERLKDFKIPGWVRELGDLFGGIGDKIGGAFKSLAGIGDGVGIGGGRSPIGGEGGQPRGVQAQLAAVRKAFPGTPLISGFRPGAVTPFGNESYHAKGRAVDLPPNMAIFNWIRANFGSNSKELFFSPADAAGLNILNGKSGYKLKPQTKRDHFDHIHWAMHQGGQVGAGIPRSSGDSGTERTIRAQVGEVITTQADMGDVLAELRAVRSALERMPRQYQLAARTV